LYTFDKNSAEKMGLIVKAGDFLTPEEEMAPVSSNCERDRASLFNKLSTAVRSD
jgi:hypothetical protein